MKAKKSPCWEGYEMVGTKMKGGKKFPTVYLRKRNTLKEDQLKPSINAVAKYISNEG